MPSRKQRRRRQKERRHEYEYVYLDEEGREIDVEELPEPSPNGRTQRSAAKAKPGGRGGGSSRVVEPASWRKAARRGLIFAPFMFGVLYLLNSDLPLLGIVLNTLILMAFFVPFGYLMDKIMYRAYLRRTGSGRR